MGDPAFRGPVNVDQALEQIGVSYFQFRLLLICGLSFMADAMEVTLLSFLAVCAGSDFNLSDPEKALLTSMVFAGELIGSFFWGPLADKCGRRPAFLWGSFLVAVAGFLSGVAPNYPFLLVMRSLVGIGIGAVSIPFDLLAEMLPSVQRGEYLMYIEYFWTLGSVFVVLVAWSVLGNGGWRLLTIITSLPVGLACLSAYFFLPESPRWLLIQGRTEEAEKVMHNAACINEIAQEFSISNQECNPLNVEAMESSTADEKGKPQQTPMFKLMLSEEESKEVEEWKNTPLVEPIVQLFSTPEMRRITFPLMTVWITFGLCYYGIVLLITRLYTEDSDDDGGSCSFNFPPILENSISEVVGLFVATLFINRIGRVQVNVFGYLISGLAILVLGFPMTPAAMLVFTFVSRGGVMGASSATWVVTPELYPTKVRATGHAVCACVSKIGAFCSPYLVLSGVSVQTCAIVLAIGNVIAAVAASSLPETMGQNLTASVPICSPSTSRSHSRNSQIDTESILNSAGN